MKKVLGFSFAILVVVQGFTPEQQKITRDIHLECLSKSGASADSFDRAMRGDWPEDEAFKRHSLCVSQKFGIFNEAGDLQPDRFRAVMEGNVDPGHLEDMMRNCMVRRETPEETAYRMERCVYEVMTRI